MILSDITNFVNVICMTIWEFFLLLSVANMLPYLYCCTHAARILIS